LAANKATLHWFNLDLVGLPTLTKTDKQNYCTASPHWILRSACMLSPCQQCFWRTKL